MRRSSKTNQVADLRPTLAYFAIAAVTIAAGIALRFVPVGLPFVVTKYGGSALWAMMVYFLTAASLPQRSTAFRAATAILIATLVELLRLYHNPTLDWFRLTLAGALLLGRVFELRHLAAYTAAILASAWLDYAQIRPRLQK